MKKNRMLKLASAMVILCLITTCAISTTFAKYTTGGSVNDAARVAHWGVEVTMDGDPMFANQYQTHDTTYTGALSVKSTTDVVAPGTSSSDVSGALRFAITGTPEVAVKIDIALTNVKDVWLKKGTYYDGTKATIENNGVPTYAEFTLDADYYPVVFTLKQVADYTGNLVDPVELKKGTLKDIETFLANYSATASYKPNTKLNSVYELSWAWAFEVDNKADTLLGHLIAGTVPADALQADPANYCLDVSYELSITVTQID